MSARRRRNLVDGLLTNTSTNLCVVDSDRRIRFCSPGFAKLTGWSADQIETLICTPATSETSDPLDLFAASICPPTGVFEGAVVRDSCVLPCRDSSQRKVEVTFVPIADEEKSVARVLVLVSTVTDEPPRESLSRSLHAEITALRLEFRRRFETGSFIGESPAIVTALQKAELAAHGVSGFNICGPDGSGRRHLARIIHNAGQHPDHSFVALDCRLLLAEQVLETLRGLHRLTEEAATNHHHTGTLLLVDADHCPREVQSWILENRETETGNVRLAATSQKLLVADEADEWLIPDFCRLFETTQITLPSLHRRGHDIALLAQHFVEACCRSLETSAETISPQALKELRFYRWPGNVRELRDVITSACQDCFATSLAAEDLPFAFRAGLDAQALPPTPEQDGRPLEEILSEFERDVIRKTLDASGGNKAEAARRLGMTRPRFYRRLQTLGMVDAGETDE